MAGVPDGIYSVSVMGVVGASLVVLKIENGSITGNDTSGASYTGSVYDHDADHVKISLDVTLPPNTHGVWGTSPAEVHETRSFNEIVPKSVFNRTPHTLPGYDIIVMATQVSPDYGYLAEPDGVEQHIANLQNVLARR